VISFMGHDLLGRHDAWGRVTAASQVEIRLNRAAARRADAAIVKSDGMAAVIADARPHVVPNGVDMTRFVVRDRIDARLQLGWDPEARIALFPGCPAFANKGYDVATAAVARATDRLGAPVELKVLWDVAPSDVPAHMAAADAMVLASEQEGSPNVVKEALACELPIVATPVGDVPQLLADSPGCYVRPRTPEALGDALAEALVQGRLTCGRALLIARRLDEESIAKRVVALYHAVLRSREVAR
jgi:glycosyltransferase involved in cell wall biosynthesis